MGKSAITCLCTTDLHWV